MEGKNIMVVGASSGIGQELARKLIEGGARVYSASRNTPKLEGLAGHQNLDVTDTFELELPEQLAGLVYCPGSINLRPFKALKPEQFRADFELNALGAVRVLQQAYKPLKAAKGSSVVLFSTVAVGTGLSFHTSIAMAKGAIEGLSRSLAAEWASDNIRVNTIAPSLTDTPLAGQLLSTEEKQKASAQRHPLGRYGKAGDVGHAAAYLLQDESSWMTGQVIHLDGGLSSLRPL